MRVIAGNARGIHLSSVGGIKTRPIPDRVKGSLFNMLSGVIQDSCFLDLYAGTGAIGIEALSRGARACIFVENDRQAIETVRKNLAVTKLQQNAHVLPCDVFEIVPYLEKNPLEIDIVFAGPPYPLVEKDLYRNNLLIMFSTLCSKHLIKPEGIMILQQRTTTVTAIPPEACSIELFDTRTYGDTQLLFFKVRT